MTALHAFGPTIAGTQDHVYGLDAAPDSPCIRALVRGAQDEWRGSAYWHRAHYAEVERLGGFEACYALLQTRSGVYG